MTGLDPEAPRPPDTRGMSRECRGVPFLHEIGGTPAVQSQNRPTNPGDRHAMSRPGPEAPSIAKRAIVFGPLQGLSGKSRLILLNRPVTFDSSRRPYQRLKRLACRWNGRSLASSGRIFPIRMRDENVCPYNEKMARMAFRTLKDRQYRAIGWLRREYDSPDCGTDARFRRI